MLLMSMCCGFMLYAPTIKAATTPREIYADDTFDGERSANGAVTAIYTVGYQEQSIDKGEPDKIPQTGGSSERSMYLFLMNLAGLFLFLLLLWKSREKQEEEMEVES